MTTKSFIAKAIGAKLHAPLINSVVSDYSKTYRVAVCAVCELEITSWWDDDPDQIVGWTPWKAKGNYCAGESSE